MKAPIPNELLSFSIPLTREQAEAIIAQGPEVVIFILMSWSVRLAEQAQAQPSTTPSTPSGMVPVYEKPTVSKRSKTPGAKPGHPGACRKPPPEITRHEEHPPLKLCPDCGSPLPPASERRFRLIEDVPETHPEVTQHSIPRHWCPTCRKLVEPPVPDALPGATFGHRLVALTAWLHYGLGTTLSQILAVLRHALHFGLTEGGLVDAWQRLAAILKPWYDEIGQEVKQAGTLHADETGWRVAGRTVWLWCFTTVRATYYMIDRYRGAPALLKFFTEEFAGVLVTDFWAPYNVVVCAARQACLVHLFRELEKVDDLDPSETWAAFRKKLKRLLGDAIRLGAQRQTLPQETFASRRALLDIRRDELLVTPVGQRPREAPPQAPAALSQRPVHLLGPPGCPFGQQPRRARDTACGHHPQELAVQPQRQRSHGASDPHVRLPDAQTAGLRPAGDHRERPERLRSHRLLTAFTQFEDFR